MKKIFALALAAVMTAGMATTSFATSLVARNDAEVVLLGGFKMVDVYVDSNDNNRFNESDDTFTPDKGSEKTNGKFTSSVVVNEGDIANVDLSVVKGGKKVAIPLLDKDGNVAAQWVTENTPHTLYGLPIGAEYTLHEAAAPEGWLLADDVTFIVQDTAEVQTINYRQYENHRLEELADSIIAGAGVLKE